MLFSVDEKLRVRITDNALSRDLFPTDYYCLGDNENRPIKWLAIESLLHKQFTGASDVASIAGPWTESYAHSQTHSY
jgi:RYK receptor-like tyrosine kinase